MVRPNYCEECPLHPYKCSGAACYYDYLEDLAESIAEDQAEDSKQNHNANSYEGRTH